jgi:hypothetical protein
MMALVQMAKELKPVHNKVNVTVLKSQTDLLMVVVEVLVERVFVEVDGGVVFLTGLEIMTNYAQTEIKKKDQV